MHSEILARIYSTKTISEGSQWSFFRRRWTPCRRNVGTSEFFYQVLISSFTIKLNRLRWCWWWMLESLQMETVYIEPALLVIDFIHHHHRPSRQTPRKSHQHLKSVTDMKLLVWYCYQYHWYCHQYHILYRWPNYPTFVQVEFLENDLEDQYLLAELEELDFISRNFERRRQNAATVIQRFWRRRTKVENITK